MSIRTPLFVALLSAALLVPAAAAQAKPKAKPKAAPQYYVSLGDSYASGYQPGIGNSKAGFVYQVPAWVKKLQPKTNLKIVNFGCAGATTTSLLKQVGCAKGALGPGAAPYPKATQIAAAEKFLKANRKNVKLITVSISGNDVTRCAQATDAVACVGEALTGVNTNVAETVKRLRAAAGPKAKIIGTTYPDVILGEWIKGNQDFAKLSVVAFRDLINPALKKQYESVKGSFVDVTDATSGYDSLDNMGTLAPYGTIPIPVMRVCQFTWYCSKGDIHANKIGYQIIAQLVAAKFADLGEKRR